MPTPIPRPPARLFDKSEFGPVLDGLFLKYPGTRFNMPFVVNTILAVLDPQNDHITFWSRNEKAVSEWLREQANEGKIKITKGQYGGLEKPEDWAARIVPHKANHEEGAFRLYETPAFKAQTQAVYDRLVNR